MFVSTGLLQSGIPVQAQANSTMSDIGLVDSTAFPAVPSPASEDPTGLIGTAHAPLLWSLDFNENFHPNDWDHEVIMENVAMRPPLDPRRAAKVRLQKTLRTYALIKL